MTKMARMLIVEPNGAYSFRDVPTGYPAFNQAVLGGGYMQELRCEGPNGEMLVFLMDEEGKLKGLEPNPEATGLWMALDAPSLMPGDFFSGPVAVASIKDDDLADVPASIEEIVTMAKRMGGFAG